MFEEGVGPGGQMSQEGLSGGETQTVSYVEQAKITETVHNLIEADLIKDSGGSAVEEVITNAFGFSGPLEEAVAKYGAKIRQTIETQLGEK